MEAGIHELTAGYALDALDSEERSAYEAHLAECEHCQQELASFWTTTEALAVAASGPEPSPALRDRILADVRAEPPQNVVPFEPRRRRVAPVLGAVAAVAAVVALAVGLWASRPVERARRDARCARAPAGRCADPGRSGSSERRARRRATGRLVVDADGQAVLVLDGLGPAPAGKTYEMWIVPEGTSTPRIAPGFSPGATGREIVGSSTGR